MDQLLDHLLDPLTGSPAHGKTVLGAIALHVGDLGFPGLVDIAQLAQSRMNTK